MNGAVKYQGIRTPQSAIQQIPGCPFTFNGEGILPCTGSHLVNMRPAVKRYIIIAVSCGYLACQRAAVIK